MDYFLKKFHHKFPIGLKFGLFLAMSFHKEKLGYSVRRCIVILKNYFLTIKHYFLLMELDNSRKFVCIFLY